MGRETRPSARGRDGDVMGDRNFDPEKLEILHTINEAEMKWENFPIEIHQYADNEPKAMLQRRETHRGNKFRKLGKLSYRELEVIIPALIKAYQWLGQWRNENGSTD
jgi:hypothetical protein